MHEIIARRAQKTIYRDGDTAVKVFDAAYSKADILNEALNHARVEETGMPVPSILGVTMVDGKWAILTEYIDGKTLSWHMENEPDKQAEHLDQFVSLQLMVHAHKAPLLSRLKDKMNRKISQASLDATTRYDLHTRLESMPKHNKVCHGDFNPSNIMIRAADGQPFILDWAHATQGNASADAARTYLLFSLAGEESLAQQYMKLFCQKSDIAMQYVQKWLPIVAASQLVKEKPEEQAFLMRWIDVVEYE